MQRAAALTHCDPLATRVVVLDHRGRTAGPLEVGADVVGGHAAQHGFDAVAVLHSGQAAVVDEAGAGCAAYGCQATLGVVFYERAAGDGATGQGH